MNVADAAKSVGLSQWTIRQAARAGKIAGTREGRDWDLLESSVKAFKAKRRRDGANAPMREMMKRGLAQ